MDGSVGVTLTREVLSDTAELLQHRIRMTTAGINLKQNLTERVSVKGRYTYKSFSDGNHANELQWWTHYVLYLTPRIVIGHRFRLHDFQKQSGSGYFDPNNYIANRAFASLYFENRSYYTYVEANLRYQTYPRYGVVSANFIHGGAGSVGIKPLQNLSHEINIEGGSFATESTSGFNYSTVGPTILLRF